MDIKQASVCGSLQSSDCLVEVQPSEELQIELFSPLLDRFGEQMERAVRAAATELGVTGAYIRVTDKGALDCTLTARTTVALKRAAKENT